MLHSAPEDQAAGLRRMLSAPAIQHYVILSAIGTTHKNALLFNLASSLIHAGNSAHLMDMRIDTLGISARLQNTLSTNLWDFSLQNQPIQESFYEFIPGGRISQLASIPTAHIVRNSAQYARLSRVIHTLSQDSNIWLLDTELKQDNPFLIPEFSQSDTILIVANTSTSIKSGYSQLKHLANTMGRRKVALLVHHAEEDQAHLVYKNIATAAKDYLSISLSYLGNLPCDDDYTKSSLLGKSIIEAFPLSRGAHAFRAITSALTDQTIQPQVLVPQQKLPPLILEH